MNRLPTSVAADHLGHIIDLPGLTAAGRSGREIYQLDKSCLIPLPASSRLYLLPKRSAIGFNHDLKPMHAGKEYNAVAAFLPPGYVALSLAAFEQEAKAPRLPLFCYCAVCWYRGMFHVPAIRVDTDPKHDPSCFDMKRVDREITSWLNKYPDNRLVAHHGLVCVKEYGCPNAANLFLRRWEAPVAVSGGCNASCQGCISKQGPGSITPPQKRIGFVPTVKEIVEIAIPHLEIAPRAMVSFGQGCEGEPLLHGKLIESAIREIRRQTKKGTIHLNTNGSMPALVKDLASAGLDSIRISLNSARPALYSAYYHCRNYSFEDVSKTLRIAHDSGLWVSLNYLTFPGVTDDKHELIAFRKLLRKTKPRMIQWRNLNIDPDWYMDTAERACPSKSSQLTGIAALIKAIREEFPSIRHGYFNPPV